MSKIRSILFICTGNSCRSVMAEGLLKKKLRELGKADIKVRSAGVSAVGGMPPTHETIDIMKKEAVDVSGYKSKNITAEMIKESDLILVMEELHKHEVIYNVPEAASKTYLLKEFGRPKNDANSGRGISDPIGRPMEDYKICLEDIKKEIERISKLL